MQSRKQTGQFFKKKERKKAHWHLRTHQWALRILTTALL